MKDLIGQRFGKLIVTEFIEKKPYGAYWQCRCDCGNTVFCYGSNLLKGNTRSCGCLKQKHHLSGRKIGALTVIGISKRSAGHIFWKCTCNCGKETEFTTGQLTQGTLRSCGCQRHKTGQKHSSWKGCGKLSAGFVSKIKSCATRRSIEFNLTIEYLWELFEQQQGLCALTKLPLRLPETHYEVSHGVATASLDRKNSNLPYTKGNVQWVHKDINMMKQQFTQEKFIMLCQLVTEVNKS